MLDHPYGAGTIEVVASAVPSRSRANTSLPPDNGRYTDCNVSNQAQPRHQVYIAFGSNLGSAAGDSTATIRAGLQALALALGLSAGELRTSSLYRTAPVGYLEQPPFLNGVVCLRTSLSPEELLQVMLAVEARFGRERLVPNGPRTLDLDLLMVDDLVLATASLVLPHAHLAERRFVLTPLVELAAGLIHPVLGRTMADLLANLPDAGEQAIAGVELFEPAL